MTVIVRPAPAPWALFALWALTGLVGVLTLLGMFSIGIFVLPVAVALLVVSIVRTAHAPDGWPAIAGLGLALAVGIAWLGWVLATSGPSAMSCSGGADLPTTCTSGGRVIDPDAVEWATAAPWFAAASVVVLLTFVGHRAARRFVTAAGQRPAPGPAR
ncbi:MULTISPECIES: hypothetical protein [unclassified Knoellia]|uniref:hypothetical protein n=1 Tax=Knoellia altitudinis TaxID=3404795 RepID=UPI0036196F77